jgi:hypothetical protein
VRRYAELTRCPNCRALVPQTQAHKIGHHTRVGLKGKQIKCPAVGKDVK